MFFYASEDTQKVCVDIFIGSGSGGGGSRKGVLGGLWEFLTKDMEGMVIPDVMNDVFLVLKLHPDHFMHLS